MPYSPEAQRHLEKKGPERRWLLPAIAAAAVLLLLAGGVTGFLLLNRQKPAPTATATPSGVVLPAPCPELMESGGSNDAEMLQAIICQSNKEQIEAWHDLDTEKLKGTRTGQALDENIQAVLELKNKGMYAQPDNRKIEFGEVKFEGDTATAKTVEVWTVTFYNKSNDQVVVRQGPDTLRETYHFVKQDGKWLISSVEIVPSEGPTPGTGES